MSTTTLNRNVELTIEDCITCGTVFALPTVMRNHAYERGGYFHCPNGHSQGWDKANCKSAVDKLRSENAQLQSTLNYEKNRVEAAKKETTAIKGQMTKLKNRVANVVCPCWKRSFQNLARHMKTKHPEALEKV